LIWFFGARRRISLFSAVNCVDNIIRRAMKRFVLATAVTTFCVLAAIAQTGVNADPEESRVFRVKLRVSQSSRRPDLKVNDVDLCLVRLSGY